LFSIADLNRASVPEGPFALAIGVEQQAMCKKCDQIDITLVRYRRLQGQIDDRQMHEAANRMIIKLEADKIALHSAIVS
jgi:hypothetical protein